MRNLRTLVAVIAVCGLMPLAATAQEAEHKWQPVAPEGLPTDFDWIRLPSDEWLKGEIVSMYDKKLEFDSDELGILRFDFADIKELRSSRVVQVGRANRKPVIGRLVIDGGTATVISEDGEVAFDRTEILTVIVGTPKEINYWSGHADVGGNVRSGNTDQIDFTARLGAHRRTVKDRIDLDYVGNITRINSEDTSNNHRATLAWDRFVSQRLFVNVAGVEWYRDPFQNIANKWTVTSGLGYQIIDTDRASWSVSAGPAWQSTKWASVEPGDESSSSNLAFRIGTDYDHELTDDIDVYALYDAFFTDEESGTYTHHIDTGLEIELIGDLDFNVSWIWDHIQNPRPLEDGTLPEQDDTRLVFGLGWSF